MREKGNVEIIWRPYVKGVYSMFVNGDFNNTYQLMVLANIPCPVETKVKWPQKLENSYFEKINFSIEYKSFFEFHLI